MLNHVYYALLKLDPFYPTANGENPLLQASLGQPCHRQADTQIHNSPKNRFFIKGHRQIVSATMPPSLLSESIPTEAEPYQAQSLPANTKFVRKSKRQNPPEEQLKMSTHTESNKVLVGTSIFRGNNNNNNYGLADSLSPIPQ